MDALPDDDLTYSSHFKENPCDFQRGPEGVHGGGSRLYVYPESPLSLTLPFLPAFSSKELVTFGSPALPSEFFSFSLAELP